MNVAVAWLLAVFVSDLPQLSDRLHTDGVRWPYEPPAGADWPTNPRRGDKRYVGYQQREYWVAKRGVPKTTCVMSQSLWGLPFLAMQIGSRYEHAYPGRRFALSWVRTGIRNSSSIDRGLPLDPVWPGFIGNTAFYSTMMFGLLSVRCRRRKNPACAGD